MMVPGLRSSWLSSAEVLLAAVRLRFTCSRKGVWSGLTTAGGRKEASSPGALRGRSEEQGAISATEPDGTSWLFSCKSAGLPPRPSPHYNPPATSGVLRGRSTR